MTNETLQKLKIPAIGLVAVGILNILAGLYFLFTLIVVFYSGLSYQNFTTEQEIFYFNLGLYGIIILGILSLLFAPLIIFGALKLMRGEKTGAAKRAAVLAMIPVTSFFFPVGILFGIWALLVLGKEKNSGQNGTI